LKFKTRDEAEQAKVMLEAAGNVISADIE